MKPQDEQHHKLIKVIWSDEKFVNSYKNKCVNTIGKNTMLKPSKQRVWNNTGSNFKLNLRSWN